MIHILDRQTDRILSTLDEGEVIEAMHTQNADLIETFDLKMFAASDKSKFLQKRERVIFQDEDGSYREFVLYETDTDTETGHKYVYSQASYLELIKASVIDPIKLTGTEVIGATQHVLSGTGWEIGFCDYAGIRTYNIDEPTNPYYALKAIASLFGLKIRFRNVIKGNQVVGRYVDMLVSLGTSTGKEIELGKDLIGIKRREDSLDIVTALKCYGPENDDGSRHVVIVTDEEARQRWSRTGEHLWDRYEPESDDEDMTEARLTQLGQVALAKRVDSIVEYEVHYVSIDFVKGLEHERAFLHDRIRIKDEDFIPPLYLEADVIEVKRNPFDPSSKIFTLGQFIEYSKYDLFAQFRRFNSQVGARIVRSDTEPEGRKGMIWIKPKTEEQPFDIPYSWNTETSSFTPHTALEASEIGAETPQGAQIKADLAKQSAIDAAKLDATEKANAATTAAELYADAQADAARVVAEAYADGIVTAEEQARINDVNAKLETAKLDATQKANAAQTAAEIYAKTKADLAEANSQTYTDDQLTNFVPFIEYANELEKLQTQIDGSITTYFENVVPTSTNYPAVEWTSVDLKNTHIGDVYYDKITGYAYRYTIENAIHNWIRISDSDVTKALQDAAKAQDTADGKRRVFVAQPTPPYDVGDLWTQGTGGDLLRCNVQKVVGQAYASIDWEKAVKYTDDTRAVLAEENAKSHADSVSGAAYQSAYDDARLYADENAIMKDQIYNGASFTGTDGVVIASSNGLVRSVFNATVGVLIQKRTLITDEWQDVLFVDIDGNITFAGLLKGSDIILGGMNNQNGSLTLLDESGDAIFDLNAGDIGSSRMVIGELISPSVLSVQQAVLTIYVNASTGDDVNPGTSVLPFKTIQAAINAIPKYLKSTVTIEVATATYNETVIVAGFTGEGDLKINLNKCGINGRLALVNCSNIIDVRGQDFNNHAKIGTINGSDPISIVTCQYAVLQNLWAKANGRADYGIYVAASNVYTYHCVHERALEAGMFTTIGGNIYAFSPRGSGNKYGAKASSGSRIHMESTRPSFSSASTSQTTGGQVTESVGITTIASPGDASGATPTEPVTLAQGKIVQTSVSCLSWDTRYGWDAGNTLTQGDYQNFGNHRGLMYFDSSAIQTTLSGKTIKSVRLYMTRKNSGGDSASSMLSFYLHNYTSQPAGMPALGTSLGGLGSFIRNESKWITLPNSVGEALKAGTAKGLAIYNSSGKPYVLMNPAVQLEINYEG